MLCAEDPHAIKIIDFGLAVCLASDKTLLHEKVGSKSYRAPEILASIDGYRGPPVDVWALGITVFSLVSGFFPLDEAKPSDWRFAKLAQDHANGIGPCDSIYAMYKRQCPFSAELKELLNSMLAIDPARRANMRQVSEHRWFASKAEEAQAAFTEDGDEVLYRGAGGEDDTAPPFEMPEMAMPISRQRACMGDTLA